MDASARPWKPRRTLRARLSCFMDNRRQGRIERRALSDILAKHHDHWLEDIGVNRRDVARGTHRTTPFDCVEPLWPIR